MLASKQRFDNSILRVKNAYDLFKHLTEDKHFSPEHLSDILRSIIVFCVSALDRYIHDIIKVGIIEIYQGKRPTTQAYLKFKIPLSHFNNLSSQYPYEYYLSNYITEINSYKSFQEPGRIKEALNLIWDEPHKWQKIANNMRVSENDLKIKLNNIVIRRNQIAHEADINLQTGNLEFINLQYAQTVINFIEKLVDSIDCEMNKST